MSNLPKPSEVDVDDIIKPSLDELSEEHRRAYEMCKKQREEAFEALKIKHEEEDLEAFIASFKKGRQGKITPVENVNFPPLIDEQDVITIQSSINGGRLNFSEMQVDKQPFPINTMDWEGKKMLILPGIAKSANKYNVLIGEPRKGKEGDKVLGREVVLDKKQGGKEILKITIKSHAQGVNHKYKKMLMLNLSSPRIQKLATGFRG
ncbi:hypothetical protein ZWY2020_051111 [Hordeum vulgare]|nr:hypothetical protein ZWY2020_051111 [Hordeum vulgare]